MKRSIGRRKRVGWEEELAERWLSLASPIKSLPHNANECKRQKGGWVRWGGRGTDASATPRLHYNKSWEYYLASSDLSRWSARLVGVVIHQTLDATVRLSKSQVGALCLTGQCQGSCREPRKKCHVYAGRAFDLVALSITCPWFNASENCGVAEGRSIHRTFGSFGYWESMAGSRRSNYCWPANSSEKFFFFWFLFFAKYLYFYFYF